MQRVRAAGARLGVALVASGGVVGCSFDSKGVTELLGGTESYVNFPGERWASGHFSGASTDGDPESGEYLLAFRDTVELTLTPAGSHETCSLGAAVVYQSSWSFPDGRAAVFAFLEEMDDSGRGKLSFGFADCSVWSTGLEHAELPVFAAENYLIRDARADGDAIVEVDPWHRTQRDVALGVQRAYQPHAGGPLITLEATQLVWRDAQLTPSIVADDVTELVPIHEGVAFLAGRRLSILVGTLGDTVSLDFDTCELRPLATAGDGRGFSFLSPCDQRTLRLYNANTAQYYTIAEPADGAGARVAVSPYFGDDRVQVLTDGRSLAAPDSSWLGTLWGGHLSGDASVPVTLQKWGESAFAAPFAPSPAFRYKRPLRFLSDFDGTSGRLMEASEVGDPVELASHVAEFDGNLAIVRADSGGGQLLGAFLDIPEVLSPDVSSLATTAWDTRDETYALAIAHDTGSLDYAVLSAANWRDASKVRFQRAAENVYPSSSSWSDFGALGYLHDYDPELRQGTLSLHFVDSRDTFDQPGVGQWAEARVADHPVILYTVPRGSGAGVWVAAVK
jgi:hypothetical protein